MRPDLQQILDDIDAADRTADALVRPLTDAQFHFKPGDGWSVAQCIEHLAIINVFYGRPLRTAVDDARRRGLTAGGPIASSFFGRKFIASQEPPVKRRFTAPAQVRPQATGSRDEIMTAFHASHDTLRDIVRSCAGVDVNRATFPNPFVPLVRMRLGTALRVLPAHDRRHLWQADQVTRRADFPAGDQGCVIRRPDR
jgi:hypothetical protein